MDVNSTSTTRPGPRSAGLFTTRRVGEILGAWQAAEVRIARGFPECRGLSSEQLEDLYQETVIALLARPYASETHLRNALRQGIRRRALNVHRDARRRGQILAEHAPAIHRAAESAAARDSPENLAMLGEDRTLVLEFLAGLDPFERQVFELTAEGLRYRAIAKRLGVDVNETRRASRAIERKRAEFRLGHDVRKQDVRRRPQPLLLAPLPLLAGGVSAARRWLLGTGLSAKAAAAAAATAIIVTGATNILASGPRHPRRSTGPTPTAVLPGAGRQYSPARNQPTTAQEGRAPLPASPVRRIGAQSSTRERLPRRSEPRARGQASPIAPPGPEREHATDAIAEFGFER
jgi:RNA polymerase sigma factor (sigma-70 family)